MTTIPPPLRSSLFPSVPPFINYVPSIRVDSKSNMSSLEYGPQYWDQSKWDQDQFWRIPSAMNHLIEDLISMSKVQEFVINDSGDDSHYSTTSSRNVKKIQTPFNTIST